MITHPWKKIFCWHHTDCLKPNFGPRTTWERRRGSEFSKLSATAPSGLSALTFTRLNYAPQLRALVTRLVRVICMPYSQVSNGTLMQIWKILQYIRLHMKIVSHRLRIIAPFTFWDMRTLVLRNFCLQTYRNNRLC